MTWVSHREGETAAMVMAKVRQRGRAAALAGGEGRSAVVVEPDPGMLHHLSGSHGTS